MAVDERARHALHQAAIRALGQDEAVTLMEYLPPVGWADVATKSDLEYHRVATKSDVERLSDRLSAAIDRAETRTLRWTIGTLLTGMGIAFAAAHFV